MKPFVCAAGIAAMVAVSAASVVGAADQEERSRTDSLLIKAQKICPVSGKELESMSPVKAKAGDQTVFLCCKGCLKGQMQKEHWARIQAHLIAAQGKCPVMKKPLPEKPKATVVKGRTVFVCCPPCTKKVEADPDGYLAVVNRYLAENLQDRNSK